MFNTKLSGCPACGGAMELGFSLTNSPLSFVTLEKIKPYIHLEGDLNKAGVKMLVPWKAAYDLAYHCPACKILIVDYSKKISAKEAKAEAAART